MSTEIAVRQSGDVSLADQMAFAKAVTSTHGQSILPDAYRDNPANVLIAVGLGASMGLSPAESLYRISVIKGKPTAGAELIAANVRKAGHRLRVRGNETTCTATIMRADDPDYAFEVTRDLAWAQRMGLASNDNYKKQPGTMLQWRAITAVARLACPEALYGVTYTPDEMYDMDASRAESSSRSGVSRLRSAVPPAEVAAAPAEPVDVTAAQVVEEPPAIPGITKAQLAKLHVLLREHQSNTPAAGLALVGSIIRREIASTADLTKSEASTVIDDLDGRERPPVHADEDGGWPEPAPIGGAA